MIEKLGAHSAHSSNLCEGLCFHKCPRSIITRFNSVNATGWPWCSDITTGTNLPSRCPVPSAQQLLLSHILVVIWGSDGSDSCATLTGIPVSSEVTLELIR